MKRLLLALAPFVLVAQTAVAEPPPPPPPDVAANPVTVSGKIKAATQAPRGEVDGFVLDDGQTVHFPPHVGATVATIAAVGARIRVDGNRRTDPEGRDVVEARSVTNLDSGKSVDLTKLPPPPPPPARP